MTHKRFITNQTLTKKILNYYHLATKRNLEYNDENFEYNKNSNFSPFFSEKLIRENIC